MTSAPGRPGGHCSVTVRSRPRGIGDGFDRPGLRWLSVRSAVLGEEVACWARIPPGNGPFPVLHLLHGRGAAYTDAVRLLDRLRAAEADGAVEPHAVVAVDAPWSERASWYTDSRHVNGRPVARALLDDVLPAVESAFPIRQDREERTVGGWSMGAAGALRFALMRPDLFARVLALSPAVYQGLPPADSTTRAYGAFGDGHALFTEERWRANAYQRLLERPGGLPPGLQVALTVGDEEEPGRVEADRLRHALRRAGAEVHFNVLPGNHDWGVWRPSCDWALRTLHASEGSNPIATNDSHSRRP